MFKKVQLRFFAIITSILLAIFIALLASINLIMEAVMKKQSQTVLKQIALSIEYDSETSSFVYFPEPKKPDNKPDDEPPPPDDIPVQGEPSTDAATESSDAAESESNDPTEGTQGSTSSQPSSTSPNTSAPTNPPVSSTEQGTTGSTQSTQTTAVTDRPTISQTTTQPVTQPPTPPLPPGGEEPYPPKYPNWGNKHEDDYQKYPDYSDDNNDDDDYYDDDYYYNYPMPDDYIQHDFYDYQVTEAVTEPAAETVTEAVIIAEADTDSEDYLSAQEASEGEIVQLSGNSGAAPVLEGFTIVSSAPKKIIRDEVNNNNTKINPAPVPKSLGSIDFFVLMADKNGKYLASLNNETLEREVAQSYINAILGEDITSGMLNNFQFFTMEKENGTVMVFTDKSAEIEMLKQLTRTTILIGAVSFVLLSILAFFLSKKSIQPIKVAFEKQKQFISDASHELKTPLTIISANADVLSDEIGSNKWLVYIKAQTERMNVLVNDLLNLTRLENNTADFICGEFDLSTAVENTALPFECQAFETGRSFEIDIEEGLTLNGSERHVKQMIAIFIDNALKYSNENGTVRVTLKTQGDKRLVSVFNTGQGIKTGEEDKIFERFYRSDDSRARATGGYGLGLAIAKSIIDKHKFKVSVNNTEGESVCFNILM